ncbi:hypothetical protein [Saccharothrix australiensis]|uniref:hypothetical protein n=1 Tax=Saccharothrix australiensis TaxID=2072 RepID=UPI0011C38620|nr:hypothetical protein [Saccharothrix australiensis]
MSRASTRTVITSRPVWRWTALHSTASASSRIANSSSPPSDVGRCTLRGGGVAVGVVPQAVEDRVQAVQRLPVIPAGRVQAGAAPQGRQQLRGRCGAQRGQRPVAVAPGPVQAAGGDVSPRGQLAQHGGRDGPARSLRGGGRGVGD